MSGTIFSSTMDKEKQTLSKKIEELEAQLMPYKIAFDILQELSQDKSIDSELKGKIHETLIHYNVMQTIRLSSNGMTHQLLGLSNLQPPNFTYEERTTIQEMIKERLDKYIKNTEHRSSTRKNGTITDKILFDARNSLQKIMKIYSNNLLEYQKILEQLKELRMKNLPEVISGKLYETKVKKQMNNSKWHLINHSLQALIFSETEVSLDAYKELLQDVRKQQEEREMEVETFKELKVKYNLVDCEEYQAILNEYLQYKDAIDKKLRFDKIMNYK